MAETTENLGNLSGKILLFGGVYSNLQALQALKQIAIDQNIPSSHCICTGDIVGYCSQAEATVNYFRLWNPKSIAGNVELKLAEGADSCGCDFKSGSTCDRLSQQWYPYAQQQLSESAIAYLGTLPKNLTFKYAQKTVSVVHGSYSNVSEFIFKSTPWAKKESNFKATQSDVIIAGHCGLPFQELQDNKLWLNPGVIGMPANDGSTKVWYVILEDRNKEFSYKFHTLDYNFNLASTLMQEANLAEAYAKTLRTGLWDNMDILPKTERSMQGLPLVP